MNFSLTWARKNIGACFALSFERRLYYQSARRFCQVIRSNIAVEEHCVRVEET
jgi:hypothetical protein